MKKFECSYEEATVRSVATGQADDELKMHVAACDTCTNAVRVMQFMRGLSATTEPAAAALPQSAHLWWKAHMLEQQSAEERATLPILIVRVASYLVITLGFIGVLLWKLPQLQMRLASLPQLASLQQRPELSHVSTSLSSQLVLLVVVVLCLAAFWTFRAVLAED